jgi:hypothetical protein
MNSLSCKSHSWNVKPPDAPANLIEACAELRLAEIARQLRLPMSNGSARCGRWRSPSRRANARP